MIHNKTIGEELLSLGFSRWEGNFANGEPANNKLSLDHDMLKQDPKLYTMVVRRMCELAEPYRPSFFIGVPQGATGIAKAVAQEYGAHLLSPTPEIKKDYATKTMSYANTQSSRIVRCSGNGVLVEDVFRTGSSTEKALALPYMAGKIIAGVCVFDRRISGNCLDLPIEVHSVAQEPIPTMLKEESELWQYSE